MSIKSQIFKTPLNFKVLGKVLGVGPQVCLGLHQLTCTDQSRLVLRAVFWHRKSTVSSRSFSAVLRLVSQTVNLCPGQDGNTLLLLTVLTAVDDPCCICPFSRQLLPFLDDPDPVVRARLKNQYPLFSTCGKYAEWSRTWMARISLARGVQRIAF